MLIVAVVAGGRAIDRAAPPPLAIPPVSTVVLDDDGVLLRAFTVGAGRWRLPVAVDAVDPGFIDLLIAFEDSRFRDHGGVDPRAAARAAMQAVRAGRIVSGASTLTMQTVRLLTDARERTPWRKATEAFRAWQMERRLTKDEILARYLHAAPYGGNIEGVRAAALAWFGREPGRLTLAQSALLIALPQSPESRRPDRHPKNAARARNRVLDRLATTGAITAADAARAKREAVPTRRRPVPRLAPHLARKLHQAEPAATVHTTTLKRDWQAALEDLASERVDRIGPRLSAAIVVAEHGTGRIRASVGAARFLDQSRAGHVDMTSAIRSPGSTLKPFIYGLGIEAGLVARNTLLADAPATFAGYQPENFDDEFHGMVTVEEALRQSLNVPAVTVLEALGPIRLVTRLEEAGAAIVLPQGFVPTLAVGLGGFGITLSDLASLYTALPDGGVPAQLFAQKAPPVRTARLLSERAAADVSAMLTAMRPPRNAPAGEIAYKTGTSYGYRDAWAVGYDARHVVAVWVGRPDGTPVPSLTGWTDAAPLLFDAFARIGVHRLPPAPVAVPTAALPPPLREFVPGRRKGGPARAPEIEIAFPPEGAVLALAAADGSRNKLVARVVGRPADTWLLNGRPLPIKVNRRQAQIDVPPGAHTLTVVTRDGASERVSFIAE
ncbi:penicillin-binding protein 1C [Acuticoccus sp. MNP-M23]|uniref:penicillin-binding protein 1C n=1 Tax=Acuticoccus sp. MNP-M23 TaxID=3072793 RepID=UPI002815EC6F|nr:penicillin-binding protein 1C [Acuticoccus sp. MNP-M23]WMS43197.1 penicillin-binding protein 1C [Acuticoccus sp. MNP-M23]